MIYKTKQEKLNACKTDNHNLIVKQLNYEHIISKQERSHPLGKWGYIWKETEVGGGGEISQHGK